MAVSSIILGAVATLFSVFNIGGLKEAWNKDYAKFSDSSLSNSNSKIHSKEKKFRWGMNLAKKGSDAILPALVAVQCFANGKIKTSALQSTVKMAGGTIPKSGDDLYKNISDTSEEVTSNFGLNKKRTKSMESTKLNQPTNVSEIKNEQPQKDLPQGNETSNLKELSSQNSSTALEGKTNSI